MAEPGEYSPETQSEVPISPSVSHLPEHLARNLSKGHQLQKDESGSFIPSRATVARLRSRIPQRIRDLGLERTWARLLKKAESGNAAAVKTLLDLLAKYDETPKAAPADSLDPRYATMPAESAALAEVLDLDLGVIIYRGDRGLPLSETESLIYESACLAAKDRLSKADRERFALLLEAMKAATEAARSVLDG